MAYAKLTDLELRLGSTIDPGLVASVTKNLDDASSYIDAIIGEYGKTATDVPANNLEIVCCNLTARWLSKLNSMVPDGATSASSSVGDFSQSVSYGSGISATSFSLYRSDLLLLGIRAKASSVYMGGHHG